MNLVYNNKFRLLVVRWLTLLCILGGGIQGQKTLANEIPGLDLRQWDFANKPIVTLNGPWAFYWQKIITPTEFSAAQIPTPAAYLDIPHTWNQTKLAQVDLPGRGYATYFLRVQLPADARRLSLKLNDVSTAYRLYVNGQLLAHNGQVGTNQATSKPEWLVKIADIPNSPSTLNIVIQVSNFHLVRGGLWNSLTLGPEEAIRHAFLVSNSWNFFLAGAILIIGLYHLGFFILRPEDKSTLYFGIFCVLITLYTALSGIHYMPLYQETYFFAMFKLLGFILFILPIFFLSFLRKLFPREFPLSIVGIVHLICSLDIVLLLLATIPQTSLLININSYIFLVLAILTIVPIFIATWQGREGARPFLLGIIILVYSIANDALYYDLVHLSPTPNLFTTGFFLFIFFQAFVLSKRWVRAFHLAESSSAELAQRNRELNRVLMELRYSNRDLEQFAYVSSHDLQEPLRMVTSFVQLLQKELGTDLSVNSKEYMSYIIEGAQRMRQLILDLLQYARMTQGEREHELLNLNQMLEHALSNLQLQIWEANATIETDFLPTVRGDKARLIQLFQNLLSNALKFCHKQPAIKVTVSSLEQDNGKLFWQVAIADNGLGISADMREQVFHIFKRLHTRAEFPGTGLGLALCKKIVENHGGDIWVESTPNQGSTFFFTLPYAA